jgi:hypothetical protein
MTVSIKDRVKQSTTTTGTGTITLSSTPSGYQSFSSVFSNGDTVYYVIENGSMYEIGVGTYSAGTLSRDTVLKSSSGTSLITLSGRSTVFVAVPADKTIYINDTNKASIGLGNLSNVSLTSPASGDIVTYNGSTWSNGNFTEQIQDAVAASFVAGTGIDISYNDGLNTISVSSSGLLQAALNLSDLNNVATARTNLGLGTAALSNSGDFYLSTNPSGYISASSVAAGYQPLDGDLTSLAAATGTDTIYYRSATNTWSPVVIGTGILFSGGTLSNTLDLSSYATSTGVAALYTPLSRTITINGSGQDLTSDRSWTVGDLRSDSSYSDPTWLTTLAWSKISGTPTTLAGYGITDGITSSGVAASYVPYIGATGAVNLGSQSLTAGAIVGTSTIGDSTSVGGMNGFDFSSTAGTVLIRQGGTRWIGFKSIGTVFSNAGGIGFAANGSSTSFTTSLYEDSTGILALRNSTNAQTFNIANTYTSSTSYEYGTLKWTSNEFRVGTSVGSAGGNQRSIVIGTWNSAGTWSPAVTVATTGATTFANTIYASSFYGLVMGNDVFFARDVASTLELRNSTTAITFALSNTYTSSTSFEQGKFQWVSNEWRIGTAVGSLGGTQRALVFGQTNAAGTFTHQMSIAPTQNCVQIGVQNTSYYPTRLMVSTDNTSTTIGGASVSDQGIYVTNSTNTINRPVGLQIGGYGGWAHAGIFGVMTNTGGNTGGDILLAMRLNAYSAGSLSSVARWYGPTGKVVFSGAADGTGGGNTTDTQFTFTVPNHTNQITTVESPDVLFTLGSKTWAAGAITTQRFFIITAPTANFASASTISTASTLSITGAPVAGTNATITNAYALNVESGKSQFSGWTQVGTYDSWSTPLSVGGYVQMHASGYAELFFHCGSGQVLRYDARVSTAGFSVRENSATSGFHWIGASPAAGSNPTLSIVKDADDVLAQRRSTNTQTFRVYNTYTSSTSGEFLQIRGVASANFEIGPQNGSGGGTLRGLTIGGYSAGSSTITPWLTFDNAGAAIFSGNTVSLINGTTAQTLNIANTYTSSTNFEYGRLSWTSNQFRIGSAVYGTGQTGGSNRDTVMGIWDTSSFFKGVLTIGANGGSPIFALTPYSYNGFTYTAYNNLSTSVMPAGTVEAVEVKFDLTNTKNFNTGALTTQRSFLIMAPVYACASAKTITTASTVSITGAPTASGSLTITNAYALNIENGRIYSGYAGVDSIVLGPSTCGIQFNNGNTAIVQTASNYLQFRIGGATRAVWDTGFAQDYSFGGGFRWYVSYGGTEWGFYATAGTAHTTSLVSGTNAQTLNIGNTYTSTTNFEYGRFQWSSNEWRIGTAVGSAGGTSRNTVIGAWNTAGTWIPKVVIDPSSTGAFYLGGVADGSSANGNTRGQYAIDLQLYRTAATQIAGDYNVAIGTQCTSSGGAGSVAIGRNVSVTDSLGGSVGIGRNLTVSGYRAVAIGSGSSASADSIAIGTGSVASHSNAVCLVGNNSRWTGSILWKGGYYATPTGASYNIYSYTGGTDLSVSSIATRSATTATLETFVFTTNGARQRHKGALFHNDFIITAVRSDGAVCKFARRVFIKSLANPAGTSYTVSILSTETLGTDILEFAGASVSFSVSNPDTMTISVTSAEAAYACTGVSATNIVTAVGHPFANDDIVVFPTLTGGSSLSANPNGYYYLGIYKVINVSGNTFQLATPGSSTTPLALGSDISAGTVCRPVTWYKASSEFSVSLGGY